MFRLGIRCGIVVLIIVAYLFPGRRGAGSDEFQRCLRRARRYCHVLNRILGWRVRICGRRDGLYGNGLYVANHMSYIDPLVLMALAPMRFITSQDVARSRLLGGVARRAGCLFTDRRNPRAARRDADGLAAHLHHAPVAIFPEATSSDGSGVLPFKPAFFSSALAAACPVRPLCIRYLAVGGRPFAGRERDRVCWHGDMRFMPHLWRLLHVTSVHIEIHVLEPLTIVTGQSRKQLAVQAHKLIASCFLQPAMSSTYNDSGPNAPHRRLPQRPAAMGCRHDADPGHREQL